MQRDRVQDQYPWTWEIPLAILCGVLVVGVGVLYALFRARDWI